MTHSLLPQFLRRHFGMNSIVASPDAANHKLKPKPAAFHSYPSWSPRFWHGLRFGEWLNLLYRNRFRVAPLRWPMAAIISGVTPINNMLGLAQRLIYGRRIAATEIAQPPVFIIGHWRKGIPISVKPAPRCAHSAYCFGKRFITSRLIG